MDELKPVKEFVTIELWQYESGEIGWRMKSNCNPELDCITAENMVAELADTFIGRDNPLAVTAYIHKNGLINMRWDKTLNFKNRVTWLWIRRNIWHLSGCLLRGDRIDKRWLKGLWSLQFYWDRARGKIRTPQSSPATQGTAAPAPVVPLFSEHSKGLEKGSAPPTSPGQVLPFRRHPE